LPHRKELSSECSSTMAHYSWSLLLIASKWFGYAVNPREKPRKKPASGSSMVPARSARSSSLFPSSQLVSGSSTQLWQAARLDEKAPPSGLSMQTGSFEHHEQRARASYTSRSKRPGAPCATNPPSVPSESPEAV